MTLVIYSATQELVVMLFQWAEYVLIETLWWLLEKTTGIFHKWLVQDSCYTTKALVLTYLVPSNLSSEFKHSTKTKFSSIEGLGRCNLNSDKGWSSPPELSGGLQNLLNEAFRINKILW